MRQTDKTVVFDFDHTLTSWDSSDRFFRWLLKRQLWRIGLLGLFLPVLGPLLLIKRTRRWPVWVAVWVATLGRSQEGIGLLAKEHVRGILASQQSLLLQDGIRQLREHEELGHRVVIATGSLAVLAQEFLDQGGLGQVPLVGSSFKPFLWGMVSNEHCFGVRKIPMLSDRGFPPPWSVTYTDHECDLPVIGLSAQCFLVNPKPSAIQVITQKLSFTPEVLNWR